MLALVKEIESPVLFWIAPPVQVAADEQVPPLPATVRPPAPVLFKTMPLVPPLVVILRKVKPPAPMVVLTTLSAVPVVDERIFGEVDELLVV